MDFYVWVMSRLGLDVSSIGYFLYVDGDRFKDKIFLGENEANMSFKVTLIAYETDISWVERTLVSIRNTLHKKRRPPHHPACELGSFIEAARPNP